MSEACPGAGAGLLVGGTKACALVGRAELFPPMGRAMSDGAFWGICELSTAQAACLLMGGAVFLSCQLFGMSSIGAWRQLGEDKSWH